MPPKFSFLKWVKQTLAPEEDNKLMVVQDFGYNLSELKEGLDFVDKQTKIYPLWLCPTRHWYEISDFLAREIKYFKFSL